ncbi:MAG TPA: hypothetical protein DCS48_07820 [Desulfovibrio sp.]|nr:hypothetical protein [Desulfovibrio sp.]
MNKGKAPERKKIKGFCYEIDENGAIFSTKFQPGYGVGRQIKPVKVGGAYNPTYTIHRGGVAKVIVMHEFFPIYFDRKLKFGTAWMERIRQQADVHNLILKKEYKRAKAEGRDMTPPPPAPVEQPRKSIAPSEGWLKFWMEGEVEYRRRTWTNYTQKTGLNAFDPQVCPLG